MKLLSLNIQSAANGKKFYKYIKEKSKTVDVFCFQEVYDSSRSAVVGLGEQTDVYRQLKVLLKGHDGVNFPVSDKLGNYFKLDFPVTLGLVIFYKKGLRVKQSFGKFVAGSLKASVDFRNGKESNAVQVAKIISKNEEFWVLNFHGASRPGDKLDTPKRIEQSEILLDVLKKLSGPKILCGDFNLMPQTRSIKMLEQSGLVNLIKTYKIKNTRNSVSWKRYNNRQSYADFTFVSKDIKVTNFKVPYNLVSDHLPMVLDFEILI